MINGFRLFGATLQYSVLGFLPASRKKLFECLSEVSEDEVMELCGQEILEVWMEQFGVGGLILGTIALFLFAILLMTAVDLAIARISNTTASMVLNSFSGLFCIEKYRYSRSKVMFNFLVIAYVGIVLYGGFYWSIAALFLTLLVIESAYAAKGGRQL